MKLRTGFISNSSSSCFILDLRVDGVKELLEKLNPAVPNAEDCGRMTAKSIGKDVKRYIDNLDDDNYENDIRTQVLKVANDIGIENVVLLRESDEDDIQLFNPRSSPYNGKRPNEYQKLDELKIVEFEYH
jgi:hypothetical protein